MKLRITKNNKDQYFVEEDIGRTFLFWHYPKWEACRAFYTWDADYLIKYKNILHYNMNDEKSAIDTKQRAIDYAKCLWYAYTQEETILAAKKAKWDTDQKKEVVLELDFFLDDTTGEVPLQRRRRWTI